MSAPGIDVSASGVAAEILYLSPNSTLNRRYVAPGIDVNTGQFEPHRVVIHNARPVQDQLTLASHGFVLAQHRSRVGNFKDKAEVEAIYPAEIMDAVKTLTGADLVVPLGWIVTVRSRFLS